MAHHAQTFILFIIFLSSVRAHPPLPITEADLKEEVLNKVGDFSFLGFKASLGAQLAGNLRGGDWDSWDLSFGYLRVMEELDLQVSLVMSASEVSENLGDDVERKMVLVDSTETQEEGETSKSEMQKVLEAEEMEEEEFSFVCVDPETSPISADDLFYEGQIRPVYPLFNQALIFGEEEDEDSTSPRPQLRKVFIEHPGGSSKEGEENPLTGTFCEWSGKVAMASPDRCKKSNSTGFSKLWRFRDLLHRSSSDGKDTFVFLHPSTTKKSHEVMESGEASRKKDVVGKSSDEASVLKEKVKVKATKSEKPVSAHERHYMRNRVLKEEEKRRTYLPYKVGFFTSANGLSRNIHPF